MSTDAERRLEVAEVKVARRLTQFELAVVGGTDRHIQIGDLGRLYELVDVKDPDTEELLGSARVFVANFEVRDVADRYSILRITDRYRFGTSQTPRPKNLVDDPFEAGAGSVHVAPGYLVVIERLPPSGDDDIPF